MTQTTLDQSFDLMSERIAEILKEREQLRARVTELELLLAKEIARQGAWPNGTHLAFVQGAQWGEFEKTGGTMWGEDRERAEAEAVRRFGEPKTK